MRPTILKIGGSLLTKSDWSFRLQNWLAKQSPGIYLAIVGGGSIIDSLRQLDSVHSLNQTLLHWQCIELLDATFEIATELLFRNFQDLTIVAFPEEFKTLRHRIDREKEPLKPELVLVRISSFYCQSLKSPAGGGVIKPEIGWQTTSDTIAMYLAQITDATRCVLFKSCEVDHFSSLAEAAEADVVDAQVIQYVQQKVPCELVRL